MHDKCSSYLEKEILTDSERGRFLYSETKEVRYLPHCGGCGQTNGTEPLKSSPRFSLLSTLQICFPSCIKERIFEGWGRGGGGGGGWGGGLGSEREKKSTLNNKHTFVAKGNDNSRSPKIRKKIIFSFSFYYSAFYTQGERKV